MRRARPRGRAPVTPAGRGAPTAAGPVAAAGLLAVACLGFASCSLATSQAPASFSGTGSAPGAAVGGAPGTVGAPSTVGPPTGGSADDRPPASSPTDAAGSRSLDLKVAKPGSDEAQIASVLQTRLLPRSGGGFGADRIQALPGQGPREGLAVRVDYPAGSASARSATHEGSEYGGAQVYLLMPGGPLDAATLSYCLRFPVGFDFVKGGKLPGLFGGTVTSGRHIPDGTDGWSTRYMWRRGGAGEVYAYLPTSVAHGTSLGRGSWSITPGRWQCLAQTVILNTPGVADGSITVRLDGRPVFAAHDLLFRTTDGLHVDGIFFSTFFGGGDPSWASPRDQYADFADFSVTPAAGA